MLHVVLKYPEIFTNLVFINIHTTATHLIYSDINIGILRDYWVDENISHVGLLIYDDWK